MICRKYAVLLATILFVSILLTGFSCAPTEEEPAPEEIEEEVEEGVLSSEDVEMIKNSMEQELGEEKELIGEEYRLHSIEYDAENNQLNLMVDYQVDPLPSAEELIDTNEAWTWKIAEAIPGISEKDFNIRVTAVTKTVEDEFISWGSTRYLYDTGEYTWREDSGMEVFD